MIRQTEGVALTICSVIARARVLRLAPNPPAKLTSGFVRRNILNPLFLVSIPILCSGIWTEGIAQDRVALVVGNGAYEHVSKLRHSVGKARAVGEALRTAGFEVTVLEDADIVQFDEALERFKFSAREGKAGLFYFAGHGISHENENYLLPVDASPESSSQLKRQAVSLLTLLKDLGEGGLPARMIVLDSCHPNPLRAQPVFARGEGLAGLGDAQLPPGTMVLYSAGLGKTALDGDASADPFTLAFTRAIQTPGENLFDAFIKTSEEVHDSTDGEQLPWLKFDGAGRVFRELTMVPDREEKAAPFDPASAPVMPMALAAALASSGNQALAAAPPPLLAAPMPPPPVPLPSRGYFTNDEVFQQGPYQSYNSSSRREILKAVQTHLDSGADGRMGLKTQAAILAYQAESQLPPTGLLDAPTIAALGLEGIEENAVVSTQSKGRRYSSSSRKKKLLRAITRIPRRIF